MRVSRSDLIPASIQVRCFYTKCYNRALTAPVKLKISSKRSLTTLHKAAEAQVAGRPDAVNHEHQMVHHRGLS